MRTLEFITGHMVYNLWLILKSYRRQPPRSFRINLASFRTFRNQETDSPLLVSRNTTSGEKLNVPALEHSYYSTNAIRNAAIFFDLSQKMPVKSLAHFYLP